MVQHGPVPPAKGRSEFSTVSFGHTRRVSLMVAPKGRGTFQEQANEVFSAAKTILAQQEYPTKITSQTIFLQDPADQKACEQILKNLHGQDLPATNFVLQSPCCGAALAVEAWAVRADTVQFRRVGRHAVVLEHDGVQWAHCAGVQPEPGIQSVYDQTFSALSWMRNILTEAGFDFAQVVRTWFYLGDITGSERGTQRYKELNRARTDFYSGIPFHTSELEQGEARVAFPASTGIGMNGTGLVVGCTAFRTTQENSVVLPLENPQQIPAYSYHPKYSPQSPKFSRALALLRPGYAVTWISGTASIVDSESRHLEDIEGQTQQTIDNIERLIAPENFVAHGVAGAGATLKDLAKVRIYIKRHSDYAKCKAICEQRFGTIPAIYAVADVCRPELLVEIEGIAFSGRMPVQKERVNGEPPRPPVEGK
jgi:enamine deaminase RidA (YjgF/YER057c/UK114 family)